MKKIYILFIVLLISTGINAQDKLLGILPLREGKVAYFENVKIQGVSKDEIYKRVKLWFIDTYSSGKDVIQLDDKESGELIGKGCFRVIWNVALFSGQSINIWKTIRIHIQNENLSCEITDLRVKNFFLPFANTSTEVGIPIEQWNKGHDSNSKKVFPIINNQIMALILSLENAIKKGEKES